MESADQAENESIGRFRRFEALWRQVAEAIREADARARLERALEHVAAPRRRIGGGAL